MVLRSCVAFAFRGREERGRGRERVGGEREDGRPKWHVRIRTRAALWRTFSRHTLRFFSLSHSKFGFLSL